MLASSKSGLLFERRPPLQAAGRPGFAITSGRPISERGQPQPERPVRDRQQEPTPSVRGRVKVARWRSSLARRSPAAGICAQRPSARKTPLYCLYWLWHQTCTCFAARPALPLPRRNHRPDKNLAVAVECTSDRGAGGFHVRVRWIWRLLGDVLL